jgi:hypothetical protein
MILVFGILGLIMCQLFGLAAWTMADNDLREMNAGYMDPTGRDLTNAGRTLGMISTVLLIISLLFAVLILVASILNH